MDHSRSHQEGKGKGKSTITAGRPDEKAHSELNTESNSNSLTSRLQKSAAFVASSMLSGPSSNATLNNLSSSAKGESSYTRHGSSRDEQRHSTAHLRSAAGPVESVRASHSRQHAEAQEAAFADFLEQTDIPVPMQQSEDMEEAWRASSYPALPDTSATMHSVRDPSSVLLQEKRDGDQVVALLSTNDEQLSDWPEEPRLSMEESTMLRRALFGNGVEPETKRDSNNWDSLLNFVPAYIRNESAGRGSDVELAGHMGTTMPEEASQIWLDQWSSVLASYQDEVWGDLGQLVEQARLEVHELQSVEGENAPRAPKALLRLRALLGHLRYP